jgi:hypothetical protein
MGGQPLPEGRTRFGPQVSKTPLDGAMRAEPFVDQNQVELEFKTEGNFRAFSPEGKFKDSSGVELRIHEGDNLAVNAPLREDSSKPGRVVVRFTAKRTRLDQINLRVMVPFQDGGAGGTNYELRVKDFVEVKKDN